MDGPFLWFDVEVCLVVDMKDDVFFDRWRMSAGGGRESFQLAYVSIRFGKFGSQGQGVSLCGEGCTNQVTISV